MAPADVTQMRTAFFISVEQRVDVPMEMAEKGDRAVREAMELPGDKTSAFQGSQDSPPAFRPEVEGQEMISAHAGHFYPFLWISASSRRAGRAIAFLSAPSRLCIMDDEDEDDTERKTHATSWASTRNCDDCERSATSAPEPGPLRSRARGPGSTKHGELTVKQKLEKLISLTGQAKKPKSERPAPFEPEPREPLQVFENAYPPDAIYGKTRIADGLDIRGDVLTYLSRDEAFAGLDLSTALFIDLETTGLAGGTGTVAFLVGMGYFRDRKIPRHAIFPRRPGRGRTHDFADLGRFLPRDGFSARS